MLRHLFCGLAYDPLGSPEEMVFAEPFRYNEVAMKTFSDEALSQARSELHKELLSLEETIQPCSGKRLEYVRHRLTSMHRRISWHFLFEEQNMDLAIRHEPALREAARRFAEEHFRLVQYINELIGDVQSADNLENELRERVSKWTTSVRLCTKDMIQTEFSILARPGENQ
jgi:hypothetical protein